MKRVNFCSTVLKKAFDAFDHEKKGCIGTDMVGTILTMLGHELSENTLAEIIAEVDEDGECFEISLNLYLAESTFFVFQDPESLNLKNFAPLPRDFWWKRTQRRCSRS